MGLTLALDLSGDLALPAGDGVDAGVNDHLIAAAAGPIVTLAPSFDA
jgi:hypothetical protein